MIVNSMDSSQYRATFQKKFRNFGDKTPIDLSFVTREFDVQVIYVPSKTALTYEWDYSIPVESFIHRIKLDLMKYYPRIARTETRTIKCTPEDQAAMIANGMPVDDVPSTITETKLHTYRIDKIIALRDEFVIVDEETGESFCYRMSTSGIYFLKKCKEGRFESLEEAGNDFFSRSTLIKTTRGAR